MKTTCRLFVILALAVRANGFQAITSVDGLNRTRNASVKNGGATLSTFAANYTGPQLQHMEDNARKTDFAWDGAGRTKSASLIGAEQPRASHTVYDTAGRVVESRFGE